MPLWSKATFAQAPLVESIEVRVVNVDVVVTNRAGVPVTGLTADDFELLEDGRKQPLTNFYEIESSEDGQTTRTKDGAELRPRRFFFFIDASSLYPQVRDELVTSLRHFVSEQMRPDDQASVLVWNGQIHVLSPLTKSRSETDAALQKASTLATSGAVRNEVSRIQSRCAKALELGRAGRLPMRAAYLDCINNANDETDATVAASRRMLNAMRVTLAMMGGVDGKKVMVVVGAQLPKKPGVETFLWANSLFTPFLTGWDAPRARYNEDRPLAMDVADLANTANSAGVTMYLMNAPIPADPISASHDYGVSDQGMDFFHSANTGEAFAELARLTGGMSADHRFNSDAMFQAIRRDLSSYYSLGYKPKEHGGAPRHITVRAKNREYTVRARQTFIDRTATEQMNDRVIANVFNPASNPDWPILVHVGAPERQGSTAKVALEVVIPPSAITLLPQEKILTGGFTVWIAVGDKRGALSTVSRSPQIVDVPLNEEKTFRSTPIVFTAQVTVRAGENLVSIGVTDRITGTAGFGRAVVKAE
ncbi:MAG TPA: VWA domain-containing protein [Thermoanaerobaculia bacterium]